MDIQNIDRFLALVRAEADFFERFLDEQRLFVAAVRERNWIGLEAVIGAMNSATKGAQAAERERHAAWQALLADSGLPEDSTIFRFSLCLDVEYREPLSSAYRRLRVAAMRARIENDAIGSFVGETQATIGTLLEEVFPERKGRIYGKSGHARVAGERPVVLDRAL